MEHKVGGFTLMELMVAMLIVGILAGIAIPKYLQAVDKSKFSSLQPITRKIQNVQEQYYLSNNKYAEELEDLDIAVAGEMNGATGKRGDGLVVQIGNEEDYKYVSGEKENFNNRYIAYQVHSENFGGDTHCEAKQGDNRADKLCKAVGGEYIGEHGEWLAYRLTGTGTGSFNRGCTGTPETEGSCSCGTRTREVSCNEKSGEYEYGEWSECPTQPTTEQRCSTGTGRQTREVTCKDNSWVTGDWDSSNCKKECDTNNKPAETQTCSSGCGKQSREVSCDTSTGKWQTGEWSSCPDKPKSEQACTSGEGRQTREVMCKDNSWVTGEWDTSKCKIDCKEDEKPEETQTCSSGCGRQTREVSCDTSTGEWVTSDWSGSCPDKPSSSEKCGSGYSNSSANKTRSVTCNAAGTAWTTGSWNYSACGCSGSRSSSSDVYMSASQCASGYGIGTRTWTCKGSVWSATASNVKCVDGARDICDAECLVAFCDGQRTCGGAGIYDETTGDCACDPYGNVNPGF